MKIFSIRNIIINQKTMFQNHGNIYISPAVVLIGPVVVGPAVVIVPVNNH